MKIIIKADDFDAMIDEAKERLDSEMREVVSPNSVEYVEWVENDLDDEANEEVFRVLRNKYPNQHIEIQELVA